MDFTKNTGEQITLQEAKTLVNASKKKFPNKLHSFFLGSNHYQSILEQENCIGIRIINAFNESKNAETLVLVGVDTEGNDMCDGIIVDKLEPCPSFCPTSTEL